MEKELKLGMYRARAAGTDGCAIQGRTRVHRGQTAKSCAESYSGFTKPRSECCNSRSKFLFTQVVDTRAGSYLTKTAVG